MPLPDKIANAPELFQGLELFYMAFQDLTTCRGMGYNSEGAVGWLQINEYCMAHGINGEQREDMFYHIQHLDAAYLNYKAKKLQQKQVA